MFKLPNIPSPRANSHEIADFIELECVKRRTVSMRGIIAALNRIADNDYTDGTAEEDLIDSCVESAFAEIENRIDYSNQRYPFTFDSTGNILHRPKSDIDSFWIYVYLLLSTRLNMKDSRHFKGIDGSLLFEELSAEIAGNYLGDRASVLVFGTASTSITNFENKIDELCNFMQEGGGFKNRNTTSPTAKDGKLDVVVLKHFCDQKPGKLIGFGQCKTGTNWKDTLNQLQPDSFCRKWLSDMPAFTPVRLFFLCEALSRNNWRDNSVDAGILFDRCRLMDYSNEISNPLREKIIEWSKAAVDYINSLN